MIFILTTQVFKFGEATMSQIILGLLIFPLVLLGQNGPQIQFNQEQFDFGEISRGDIVEHIFKFTNVGGDTLQILNV